MLWTNLVPFLRIADHHHAIDPPAVGVPIPVVDRGSENESYHPPCVSDATRQREIQIRLQIS
jgi:hypothetical protein